jgi:hypothetical protein
LKEKGSDDTTQSAAEAFNDDPMDPDEDYVDVEDSQVLLGLEIEVGLAREAKMKPLRGWDLCSVICSYGQHASQVKIHWN